MTARLRELAEGWKGGTASHDYEMGRQECAAELLAILDAEGDGGAVAWLAEDDAALSARMSGHMGEMNDGTRLVSFKELKQGDYRHVFPLYPHPARSGVVSDAMVAAYVTAVNEYLGNLTEAEWQADRLDKHAHLARVARIGLTAALTHFAQGERHDSIGG